jgi:hypothetical protein
MIQKFLKNKKRFIGSCCFLLSFSFVANSQNVTIIDSKHYSNVFGEMRNYRIFLPPHYFDSAQKKYPVIYFLHGWSQRYFGSGKDEYAGFDKGKQNNGDNIANFVSTHEVIVVKSDGYNRSPNEEYYLRPYNIGPVETFASSRFIFLNWLVTSTHITAPSQTANTGQSRVFQWEVLCHFGLVVNIPICFQR